MRHQHGPAVLDVLVPLNLAVLRRGGEIGADVAQARVAHHEIGVLLAALRVPEERQ